MQPRRQRAVASNIHDVEICLVEAILKHFFGSTGIARNSESGPIYLALILEEERFESGHIATLDAVHELGIRVRRNARGRYDEQRFQIYLLDLYYIVIGRNVLKSS